MAANKKKKGWGYVRNSTRWHYFDGATTTLCGKFWMPALDFNELEDSQHHSEQNCKACKEKRQKLYGTAAT